MSTITFTDVISDGLQEFCQMQPEASYLLAYAIACAAAKKHGGSEYPLHTFCYLTRAERNDAIRREFNGQNLQHICRKFNIHRATVYRAVKRGE